MKILKIETNKNIEIVEYGPEGRKILVDFGIFDSKRQARKAIEAFFNVKDLGNDGFEIEETE